MTYSYSRTTICKQALLLIAAVGCGGGGDSSTIEGRITDGDGDRGVARLLGGEGTATAASSVRAYTIADDGSLVLVGEASVEAEASYAIEVPDGAFKLIVEAYDETEAAVGSVIVEATGSAGATIEAAPITSETSLEAQVLIEMVASGAVSLAEANAVDLRARLDAQIALALRAKEESGADISADVRALAEAVAVAQAAEIEAYAAAGIEITQRALFEAEVAAAQALAAGLHAAERGSAEVVAEFYAALDAVAEGQGVVAEQRARAEAWAGLGFRATLEASADSDELVAAALTQAALLEARASEAAIEAALEAGGVLDLIADLALGAMGDLLGEIELATSVEAVASAFADLSVELVGDGEVQGSVLGDVLEVNAATEASAQAAVDATASAAATLDASLQAAFDTAGSVDAEAMAEAIAAAYGDFYAAVDASVADLAAAFPSADAQVTATILIAAEGAFRLGD